VSPAGYAIGLRSLHQVVQVGGAVAYGFGEFFINGNNDAEVILPTNVPTIGGLARRAVVGVLASALLAQNKYRTYIKVTI
jgi:hypothetical protein